MYWESFEVNLDLWYLIESLSAEIVVGGERSRMSPGDIVVSGERSLVPAGEITSLVSPGEKSLVSSVESS